MSILVDEPLEAILELYFWVCGMDIEDYHLVLALYQA